MNSKRRLIALLSLIMLLVLPVIVSAEYELRTSTAPHDTQSTAQVQLFHLAPFSATDTTVSITLQEISIGSLTYRDRVPYQPVPIGTATIAVFAGPSITDTPLLTTTLSVEAQKAYSVFLFGDAIGNAGNVPLQFIMVEDGMGSPSSTDVNVRLLNTTSNQDQFGSLIDLAGEDGLPIPGLTNVARGQVSDFVPIVAGESRTVQVQRANGGPTLVSGSIDALAGERITIAPFGGANGYPVELLLVKPMDVMIFLPLLSTSFPLEISPLQQASRPVWLPGSDLPRIDTTYVATITNTSSTTAYSVTLDVEIHAAGYYTKTVTPTLPVIAPGATVPIVVPVDNYRFYAQNLRVVAAEPQLPASYQTLPVTLTDITCQNNGIGIITGIVRNTTTNALIETDIVVWRTEAPPHTAIASITTVVDAEQERSFQTSAMYICDGQEPATDVELTDFTGVAVGRPDIPVQ